MEWVFKWIHSFGCLASRPHDKHILASILGHVHFHTCLNSTYCLVASPQYVGYHIDLASSLNNVKKSLNIYLFSWMQFLKKNLVCTQRIQCRSVLTVSFPTSFYSVAIAKEMTLSALTNINWFLVLPLHIQTNWHSAIESRLGLEHLQLTSCLTIFHIEDIHVQL